MTSKKYKILFVALMFLSLGAFAQVGNLGSVYDSAVIPAKRMPQQNEFWNGSYNFPAKPRDQWEIGISTGLATVSGDVASRVFTAPNFGIHVRKSFGYLFSVRLQYINTIDKGLNWQESYGYAYNPAWNSKYNAPLLVAGNPNKTIGTVSGNSTAAFAPVFYNYKTHIQDLSLQGVLTLNNIRFHKANTGIVIYGGAGIGATAYNTMVNTLDASGRPYNFSSITSANYPNRRATIKALKALMDNTYETAAETDGGIRHPKIGKNTLKPSGTVFLGMAFKLSRRINLALEDRWTFVKTDLLDGQEWQESSVGSPAMTRDFDSYNYASVGLNLNLGAKAVQPLWWLNPLDYAYDELMNHRHVKIPKAECPDADGDGVCDHLDREPNTPAGCPVDTHGVSLDTDGDGVPDCKDKEKITPTQCQPVNADGVGHCPDPECCKQKPPVVAPCPTDYPSLTTKGLNTDNKALLATVAAKLKANPTCTITITGYPATSKHAQAECNARLAAIKTYLVEKEGITADRVTVVCDVNGGGDKNTIDIKSN